MQEGAPIIIKKKKAHAHGHHGGAWKVAYADFVTAMMAFFMVMWIMGMSDQTRSMVQGYFNDPVGFMKNQPMSRTVIPLPGTPNTKIGGSGVSGSGQSEMERKEYEEALAIKKKIEEIVEQEEKTGYGKTLMEGVELTITQDGLQIEFIEKSGEVFFELGSAVIRPAARRLIARVAPILAASGRPMILDGHTDARPFPSPSYDNWDLSGDRAAALRRALKAGGVPASQIIAVRANADRVLREKQDPFHFSNRRVSVLLPYETRLRSAIGLGRVPDRRLQGMFKSPIEVAPDLPKIGPASR
jgi:chemotaxis protein MotB